jgi:hypothetical protein
MRTVAAWAALAVLGTGLAGCSSQDGNHTGQPQPKRSSSTPSERVPFEGLTAGQIAGLVKEEAESVSSLTAEMDLSGVRSRLAVNAKGECAGTTIKDGLTIDIVRTMEALYWRTDWRELGGAQMEATFGNRWVREDRTSKDYRTLHGCDLTFYLMHDDDFVRAPRPLTRGAPTTIDGVTVVPVSEHLRGRKVTRYVAAEGKPYVLRLVGTNVKGAKIPSVNLSGYNEPVPLHVPPATEVIDGQQLDRFIDDSPLQAATDHRPNPGGNTTALHIHSASMRQ